MSALTQDYSALGQSFGGLGFNGSNQYVDFGSAPSLGSATFTLETWFNWTGSGSTASTGSGGLNAIPLISKLVGEFDGDTRDGNYFLGIQGSVLAADFEEGIGGASPGLNHPVTGVTPITPNVWHHAAVTYDGTTWALYLDGALETTLFVGQPPRWDSIQHAALASALNSTGAATGFFAGVMDEVRIWNYARSSSQISSNLSRTISSAPGLLGRWSLDETNGTVAADSSGTGADGTLFNGPLWTTGYPFSSAPSVALTNPAPGATFFTPVTIAIGASASDADGSVTKVEFYAGANKLGQATNSPYTFSWTNPPAGYFTLSAVATDNSSLSSTSAPVSIVVQNPIVQLTSPTNGAQYIAPDPVTITANASDGNGVITLVQFFDGATQLGQATTRPFTINWNSTPGNHALSAVSTAGGIQNTSAAVNIVVASNLPPVVTITSPADNASQLQGPVTITASASDGDDSVAKVEFYANAAKVGQATNAPFSVTWTNAALGNYSFTAVATDSRGGASTSAVVHLTIITNAPPAVAITNPANNSLFGVPLNLTIAATATDSDDPVTNVAFYANGTFLGQGAKSPYTYNWSSVPPGVYALRAVATDNGGLSTTSAPVNITVLNDALPVVSITNPVNNASFTAGGNIPINAVASDSDGSVTNLAIYAGVTLLGQFSAAPYNLTWTNVPAGNYVLTAVAIDNAGLRATSAPVNISVIQIVSSQWVAFNNQEPGASNPNDTFYTISSIGTASGSLKNVATGATLPVSLSVTNTSGAAVAGAMSPPTAGTPAYNVFNAYVDWNAPPSPGIHIGPSDAIGYLFTGLDPNKQYKFIATAVRGGTSPTPGNEYSNRWTQAEIIGALSQTAAHSANIITSNQFPGSLTGNQVAWNAGINFTGDIVEWDNIVPAANGTFTIINRQYLGSVPGGSGANALYTYPFTAMRLEEFANAGPLVRITGPADNTLVVLPTNLVITAFVSGFGGTVTNVAFYNGASKLGDDPSNPYSFAWNTVIPGNYTLRAVGSDNTGLSVTSAPVQITVQSNVAPLIAIASPLAGAVFNSPANVPITVAASDSDGAVTNVQFYANGSKIGQSSAAPFNFTWGAVPVGTYDLAALAADDHGAVTTSSVVRVFVITATAPTVSSFVPAAGLVTNLTQITVNFTEPVDGVNASDFLINNLAATSVTGSNATYTFSFPQPLGTNATVTWAANHGIVDRQSPPIAFDGTHANETVQYTVRDTLPPVIATISPLPGTTVRDLTHLEVTFNEPVAGVNASDLLINNVPAQTVSGSSTGPYVFQFPQPATGTVAVTWAANHGITDLADPPNAFTGASFNYVLNPNAVFAEKVLVSEIMFHASSEKTNDEWVELYNSDTAPMNVTGWRLKSAVDFTFPNMSIPAGGYLVVAADLAAFHTNYPGVTNVIGNWSGAMPNHGATVKLVTATGETVNEVSYAEEGDWATRFLGPVDNGYRGWLWDCPAAGFGKSLELVNPAMPNQYGQNWKSSITVNGTPGRTNSVAATNIPPIIVGLAHFPIIPRSTDSVVISAQVFDERASVSSVTLFYRNAATLTPGAFTSLPMFDDGGHNDGLANDHVFAATIPAQTNNAVIEFYVQAIDLDGKTNTYPQAARDQNGVLGQVANALYQADDTVYTASQPLYKFIMTESERQNLNNIALNSPSGADQSNAEMNNTFISSDGTGTEFRYSCGIRERGNGTRGRYPANQRIAVPTDRRWKGQREFNLNTQFTESQFAGYLMATRSGLDSEFARIVRVRLNNRDLANTGSPQFGCYIHVEAPNSDMAGEHFPLDGNGNMYRCISPSHQTTLDYLGTNPVSYVNVGYAKVSNVSENDYTDLINLTYILNNAPNSNYTAVVRQVVNVENWMLYFAVNALLENEETSLGNGVGDDYGCYRGLSDTRFVLICHDWDTVLGEGDTGGNLSSPIFRATALPAVNRFMKWPEFAPIYYATLKRLTDTTFAPINLGRTLNEGLAPFVPGSVINSMTTFASNRVNYVVSQIPLGLTITSALGTSNGLFYTTSPTISLRGQANAIDTRSILVNGAVSVWSAWEARWTNNFVSLQPGLNNILVQALGANGLELTNTSITVWYDTGAGAGTTANGTISSSVNWTPAGGPYRVTSNLIVGNGGTLTIQPGTTVYVSPGVTITVNGTGKILAQGTANSHISFTRVPGGGNWGSVDFVNSSVESTLSYVDFDSCGGTTIDGHTAQIHVNNAIAFFDHLTWPASGLPAVQYISTETASFVVQNCIFPTYPNPGPILGRSQPELMHGAGGILAGGHGIIRDCYFGHSYGFNDTIDFTGGQRQGAGAGPIFQVIHCVFDGAGDDCLDLDSTDAWIEGNIFTHVHRDPYRTDNALDTGSAISGGVDFANQNSDWTIINNLFYDVDHVFLNKSDNPGGGRIALLYNTIAHVAPEFSGTPASAIGAFDWADDGSSPAPASVGSGLYAAHNIIYDCPLLNLNYFPANYTIILDNNILPAAFKGTTNEWTGGGSGNQYLDPKLNLGVLAGTAPTNVTVGQLRQALQLQPGSPALGAAFGGRNIGGLNPYGIAIAGEPGGTTPSTSATFTVGPGGVFDWGTITPQAWGYVSYKWNLDNGPWSAEIAVTNNPTINLSNLTSGSHTVYVVGKNDAPPGYYQDDTFLYPATAGVPAHVTASRTWTVNPASRGVRINEILASNQTAVDHEGTHPDLIELRNLTAVPLGLGGMRLTDDPADPDKFTFPLGTTLPANGYLVVYANNPDGTSGLHIGFNISKSGQSLYLYDRVDNGGVLLDSATFGLQLTDYSIGLVADGNWGLCVPTPAAANVAVRMGDPKRLYINEWLASESLSSADDFVEIYNPSSSPIGLGGLYFTENPAHWPNESRVPDLSFIGTNDYLEFKADGNIDSGADHLNFSLASERGLIALMNTDLSLIDCVIYGPQTTDISQGLSPNGSSNTVFFSTPSPGGPNPTLVITNQGVVINEVLANNSSIREPDGSAPDWVEFFNQSTNAVDMSDLSFTDTAATPRLYVFPAGSIIPGRGFKRLLCDTSIPVGPTNSGFTIKQGGGTLFLFDKVANGGGLLSSVAFGLQATDVSIGRVPNGTGNWVLTLPTPNSANIAASLGSAASVSVNEWMAVPSSGEDWFELWNPNPQPVAIGGYFLTDDLTARTKSPIPALSFLGGSTNGYQRFWADNSPSLGADHTNFKLNNGGESIGFCSPSGVLINGTNFLAQDVGVSEGRFPDGSTNIVRFPGTDSPGEPNYLVLPHVVINEALTHTDPPLEDAIELRNLAATNVNIGGWFLSDAKSKPTKYRINDGTILPANGFLVFYEYQFNDTNSGPAAFALSSGKGDDIYLSTGNTNGALTGYRAHASFGPAQNAVSFGRYITSDAREEFVAMRARSLGQDEPGTLELFRAGTGLPNPYPQVGPIVVSQIMYHPPNNGTNDNTLDEYVELRNITGGTVPLYDPLHATNTWHLRDAVDYDFPPGVWLGGMNDRLLVVSFDPVNNPGQLALFQTKYGISTNVPIYGPYIGKLKNSDAKVELWKPDPPDTTFVPYVLVERIHYFDSAPWPAAADGTGATLQRFSLTGFGNDPTNWTAALPNFAGAGDMDGDGLPDWWEFAHGLDPQDATGQNGANGDPDGDGVSNMDEYLAGTDPQNPQSNLRLTITGAGPGPFTLEFTAQAGHSYTLQSAPAIDGPWTPVANTNAVSTQTITIIDSPTNSMTFYRIRTPQLP